ncbi:MAG: lysophospholipid acyltransferase family protein [Oscillospiraceae bacterium]|nr:lysophospholipid acyltransferase family protein [Oscillospiraceae bacterium]
MLLKIFAAIGAGGSVLHTLISSTAGGALKVTGELLLRFVEYFFGAHLVYAVGMLLATELLIDKDKPQEKPSKFWLWHLHAVADLLVFYARADVSISGTELIPKDTRYLMVSNHRSLADPVVMVNKMPKEEITFVSKPGNLKIPIIGKVMHKCGCLPLDRENNREALKTVKAATEYINKDYCSVVIYPEGTRSKQEGMLPFHAGSFKIAQRADVPVVVVALRNTDKVIHNFPLKKTNVYIDVIGVIDAGYVKEHKTKDTAQLAQEMIEKKLAEEKEKEDSAAKC